MSEKIANAFIEALWTLEETKDAGPLTALYAENASVGNVLAPDQYRGPDGAKKVLDRVSRDRLRPPSPSSAM